jgi:hypothetical protein
MSAHDWYRRQTWTEADKSEFFARLGKSRGAFHKAQYARIQAWELYHAGGKNYAAAALDLLDMILERWKDEAETAQVQYQLAACLLELGDEEGAIVAYRATFEEQRRLPSIVTNAHIDFAWWVAVSKKQDLFIEALGVLHEFSSRMQFPVSIYASEGARALIFAACGDNLAASRHARNALEASGATHSGIPYHPTVGLVHVRDN